VPYNKEEKKERHNVASLKYYYNLSPEKRVRRYQLKRDLIIRKQENGLLPKREPKRNLVKSNGYVWMLIEDHPKKESYGGRIPEHILVAEKVLGRFLKDKEVVHHINSNKADNRTCNLLICSPSYHRLLHGWASKAWGNLCVPPVKEED